MGGSLIFNCSSIDVVHILVSISPWKAKCDINKQSKNSTSVFFPTGNRRG